MIARIATFSKFDPRTLDTTAVEQLRTTIRGAPGYVAGFHLWNPDSGKAVSFTVYETREGLEAAGRALAESGWDAEARRDPEPDRSTTTRRWSSSEPFAALRRGTRTSRGIRGGRLGVGTGVITPAR